MSGHLSTTQKRRGPSRSMQLRPISLGRSSLRPQYCAAPMMADEPATLDHHCRHITQGSGDQTAAPTGITRKGAADRAKPRCAAPPRHRNATADRAGGDPASQPVRCAAKRRRHWLTVAGRSRNRCAMAVVAVPAAAARVNWARKTQRCSVVEARTNATQFRTDAPAAGSVARRAIVPGYRQISSGPETQLFCP